MLSLAPQLLLPTGTRRVRFLRTEFRTGMTSVNTQQIPDLLMSLMAGLGSSNSLITAEGMPGIFGFADLLDPSTEGEQSVSNPLFPGEELSADSGAELLSPDGQLNALLAAAMASAAEPPPNALSSTLPAKNQDSEPRISVDSQPELSSGSRLSTDLPSIPQGFPKSRSGAEKPVDENSSAIGQMLFGAMSSNRESPPFETGLNSSAIEMAEDQSNPLETIQVAPRGPQPADLAGELRDSNQPRESGLQLLPPEAAGLNTQTRETVLNSTLSQTSQPRESSDAPVATRSEAETVNSQFESSQAGSVQSLATMTGEAPSDVAKGAKRNTNLKSRELAQAEASGVEREPNRRGESVQAIPAFSAGGGMQQESRFQQSLKQEAIDTETSRPNWKAPAEASLPSGWNSSELTDTRPSFETALQKAAETFPLESIAQQIVEVAEPDSGWISLEIQPPELGKLEIMVSKQGDDYSARIVAHEASTEEALSLQQAELLEALNQHGLELKEIQIVSDSDSGNRWNLDGSRQDQQDTPSHKEHSGRGQDEPDTQVVQSTKPVSLSQAVTGAESRQQVNFLV